MGYYKEPIFKNPEQMLVLIDSFIDTCIKDEAYPSVPALAIHLGMSERSLYRYQQDEGYEDYHDVLQYAFAMLKANDFTELHKTRSAAAEISLKRIHKLTEKHEHEHSGEMKNTIIMPTVKIGDKPLSFEVGDE